ncbi:hypothetical protein K6119_04230 [Paracrocinitomix mangrovi]|uniref:hypothetical protein n=1 Tax=Paracrocinitomix mangrovi TaxID=2862509 RepID=UPI001C8F17F5|nr:hypothetical protein [Paracrocinitomix mangrovi]UKN02721.1 hypothetical protein K6119_04230 [Paracrocinitomix mangrovi]
MKILVYSLLIITNSYAFSQDLNCSRFKNGKFRYEDEKAGVTIIERKGSNQIEYGSHAGLKIEFKVKWLDDCTYTLKVKKVIENPMNITISNDLILTVEIIETKDNSYVQKTSSNLWETVVKGELFIIE